MDAMNRAPLPSRAGFSTRAVHRAEAPPVHQTPSSVPLYQTSAWRFESLDQFAAVIAGGEPGYVYGRGYGNPTVEAFEAVLADLEHTEAAMAFDSGMAAIHAVITTLAGTGQTIVADRRLYGGTHSLFADVLPRYGVEVRRVDVADLDQVAAALQGAQLLYAETIDNPTLAVPDLAALSGVATAAGVPLVVDNTFASPYLCTPADYGVDYVVHSATKYIGGHSDLLGGAVCTSAARRAGLRATALDVGGAMQPFEAWLCLRALPTLALRLDRQCATAAALAARLVAAPAVTTVHYPGLPGHPSHALARAQLRDFGGMVSFELAGGHDAARQLCGALSLTWIAGSLGGTHTLVAHPASTTHRQMSAPERAAAGIGEGTVRVSAGLEDREDVVADFDRALAVLA
jgi:methionine-gamma-lyase